MVTLDPSTAIGKLRRLIFDFKVNQDGTDAYFQDEDLQVYLDERNQNLYGAAILAIQAMLLDPGSALKWTHGMEQIDRSAYLDALKDAKKTYENKYKSSITGGGIVGNRATTPYYGADIPTSDFLNRPIRHEP